ncbi:hypothetical protein WJX74_009579 [Apatococcus lobatus]|uniref:RING-type domain-containing protein n=1 Tax=Apatococcus lobatus TaxID=904363 RepID=A0AAW1RGJ0_9CHLO
MHQDGSKQCLREGPLLTSDWPHAATAPITPASRPDAPSKSATPQQSNELLPHADSSQQQVPSRRGPNDEALQLAGKSGLTSTALYVRPQPKHLADAVLLRRPAQILGLDSGQGEAAESLVTAAAAADNYGLQTQMPEEDEDQHLCIICLEMLRQIIFIPCGHVLHCRRCNDLWAARSSGLVTCPLCRSKVLRIGSVEVESRSSSAYQ